MSTRHTRERAGLGNDTEGLCPICAELSEELRVIREDPARAIGPKERLYNDRIAPLLDELMTIAREHSIAVVVACSLDELKAERVDDFGGTHKQAYTRDGLAFHVTDECRPFRREYTEAADILEHGFEEATKRKLGAAFEILADIAAMSRMPTGPAN